MLDDDKITYPMYLDKKVLKIVKKSLSNSESEISKIVKENKCDCEDKLNNTTIILNGGTAGE